MLLILVSCRKSTVQEITVGNNTIEDRSDNKEWYYEFYLDGIRVSSIAIDTTTDQWILYKAIPTADTNVITVQVRKYSTRAKYELYGDTIGLNIRAQLAISDRLKFVADSAGLSNTITDAANIPKWYTDYCNTLINGFTGGAISDRFLGTEVRKDNSERKDCSTWGGTFFFPGLFATYPFMPTGWNDKISGVNNWDVVGSFRMFKHIFFWKHLGAVQGFGNITVKLCGTVADRQTSSAIRYGF
jgi:peroxiredoxin